MAEMLMGMETEYAITCVSKGRPIDRDETLRRIIEQARSQFVHLPGLHPSGVFLQNSSRFYIDCGHPELATCECTNPRDLVRQVLAGHEILFRLVSAAESAGAPETEITAFRCNVDYSSSSHSTWACHESYMALKDQGDLAPELIPFLVTRVCFSGSGGFNPFSKGLEFTLSPRAHHIEEVISGSSTHSRPIFHMKNEPLCKGYRRLHVLISESLSSQKATFLKTGACALVVAMADAGLSPGSAVQLDDPLAALQCVAGDVTCGKPLKMTDGRSLTAIQIQRHYLEMAESHLGAQFMPDWAAELCALWRDILDKLEQSPASVSDSIDWSIKHTLYANHAGRLGVRWDALDCMNQVIDRATAALEVLRESGKIISLERAIGLKRSMPEEIRALEPLLQSRGLQWDDVKTLLSCRQSFFELDWRFGQLGPKGVFQMLDQAGVLNHRIGGTDNIAQAIAEAPGSGRAHVRANVIRRLAGSGNVQCDWQSIIDFEKGLVLDLSDPFISEEGTWKPFTGNETREEHVFHEISEVFDFGSDSGSTGAPSPYSRRQDAADRILSGDFAGAETLLRGLLAERFILTSTHCHMARVLLMTDREQEAREHINSAWAIRNQADRYIVPRILFFQCVFAMFDGADIAAIVGQLKTALRSRSARLDWTIVPMLDHLRPRLGDSNYEFLKVLAAVLSGPEPLTHLEQFQQWQTAVTQ